MNMKKTFILAMLILLLFIVSGCGGNDANGTAPAETTPTETPPVETTPGETPPETTPMPPVDTSGLPPDPGEAGKQTLEGIDSDGDGLRDDVQRYIAIEFADASEQVKKAIKKGAESLQDMILAANSKILAIRAGEKSMEAIGCLYFLGYERKNKVVSGLKSVVVNTEERLRSYIHNDALLGGEVFHSLNDDELAELCE